MKDERRKAKEINNEAEKQRKRHLGEEWHMTTRQESKRRWKRKNGLKEKKRKDKRKMRGRLRHYDHVFN